MEEHRYEALYRLSPRLYDFLYFTRKRLGNFVFVLRNRKFVSDEQRINKVYRREYEGILSRLKSESFETAISRAAGIFLYDLVRRRKPSVFLETGVSNGFSSLLILEAMAKNKRGVLVSTELSREVGQLVPKRLRGRWRLVVADEKTVMKKALSSTGKIDIFMHDSNHSYETMTAEFNAVKKKMRPNGIILSDDVDENGAFIELAAALGKRPMLIPSSIKCFGVLDLKGQ